MKKKSLNFIVPLVIYPFDVMVSIAETEGQLEKAFFLVEGYTFFIYITLCGGWFQRYTYLFYKIDLEKYFV